MQVSCLSRNDDVLHFFPINAGLSVPDLVMSYNAYAGLLVTVPQLE